jgi:hypothetical protein
MHEAVLEDVAPRRMVSVALLGLRKVYGENGHFVVHLKTNMLRHRIKM